MLLRYPGLNIFKARLPRIKSGLLSWQHGGLLAASVQPCTGDRSEGEGSELSLEAQFTAHSTGTICHGATTDGWDECKSQCSVITGVFSTRR